MHHFPQHISLRTTIFTEYSVFAKCHEEMNPNYSKCVLSYHQYLSAWYGFIQLLDIDYDAGFICGQCGDQPKAVVMDATTLSFRKDFNPSSSLIKPMKPHYQTAEQKQGR